ncbi:hypothetical protein AEGHOMDF_4119 [Methylobacterium soli]|nr:hypothetical protein AEGHOMDF_4119 [Methylobacterium soli]
MPKTSWLARAGVPVRPSEGVAALGAAVTIEVLLGIGFTLNAESLEAQHLRRGVGQRLGVEVVVVARTPEPHRAAARPAHPCLGDHLTAEVLRGINRQLPAAGLILRPAHPGMNPGLQDVGVEADEVEAVGGPPPNRGDVDPVDRERHRPVVVALGRVDVPGMAAAELIDCVLVASLLLAGSEARVDEDAADRQAPDPVLDQVGQFEPDVVEAGVVVVSEHLAVDDLPGFLPQPPAPNHVDEPVLLDVDPTGQEQDAGRDLTEAVGQAALGHLLPFRRVAAARHPELAEGGVRDRLDLLRIAGLDRLDVARGAVAEALERRAQARCPQRPGVARRRLPDRVALGIERLAGRHLEAGGADRLLVGLGDDAAVTRADEVRCLAGAGRGGLGLLALVLVLQAGEARHEPLLAVRTHPSPVMPGAGLPELPDRRFDVVGGLNFPEFQPGNRIELDFLRSARGRGDHRVHEVGVGVAARVDQADRIALALHVRHQLVGLVGQRQRRRIGFQRGRGAGMRQAQRHASDDLAGLRHALATGDLGGERRRLVEQRHDARLPLLGDELLVRPNVEDRGRPLIEPLADDIEDGLRLAGLGRDHEDAALVAPGRDGTAERHAVGREILCLVFQSVRTSCRSVVAPNRVPIASIEFRAATSSGKRCP